MSSSEASSEIRTIGLRILRDGPTHNHLLSPLTSYLAEVGSYEVVTIRVPYEHRRLLRELDTLRYGATSARAPDVTRASTPSRRIIADDIGQIFGAIPGLTAEMALEQTCRPHLTHLNLVFAASELSLLPFEMSTAPRGFPGEGSPLSIQSIAPVVMTRSIPSAMGRNCKWGIEPKILFAAAQPAGLQPVPVQAHLLALLRALEPWIGPLDTPRELQNLVHDRIQKHLTFLPRATFGQIERACQAERFTHVHILAHTETIDDAGQSQYALALHGTQQSKDLVVGERLQAALRLPMRRRHDDDELSHPLVVSLASCDSSNQAQVVFPSMSLAHGLHAAGVPLVVGSLFPLSYRGSTVMADSLYGGLLRGRDPRRVLHDLRHDLYRMGDKTHDWASVVAYASLPEPGVFGPQVQAAAFRASMARIDGLVSVGRELSDPRTAAKNVAQLEDIDAKLGEAARSIPVTGDYCLEGQGNLASTEKQRAQLLWSAARELLEGSKEQKDLLARSRARLREARELYVKASQAPRWVVARPDGNIPTAHWVLTQVLSLSVVLDAKLDWRAWWAAEFDAQNYLEAQNGYGGERADPEELMWAHASRIELYLLAHAMVRDVPQQPDSIGPAPPNGRLDDIAKEAARMHIEMARQLGKPRVIFTTRRQLERYVQWWFDDRFGTPAMGPEIKRRTLELATALLAIFDAG